MQPLYYVYSNMDHLIFWCQKWDQLFKKEMRFEFVKNESYYHDYKGQFLKELEENSMVKKKWGATTVKYPYPCYNAKWGVLYKRTACRTVFAWRSSHGEMGNICGFHFCGIC